MACSAISANCSRRDGARRSCRSRVGWPVGHGSLPLGEDRFGCRRATARRSRVSDVALRCSARRDVRCGGSVRRSNGSSVVARASGVASRSAASAARPSRRAAVQRFFLRSTGRTPAARGCAAAESSVEPRSSATSAGQVIQFAELANPHDGHLDQRSTMHAHAHAGGRLIENLLDRQDRWTAQLLGDLRDFLAAATATRTASDRRWQPTAAAITSRK